VYSTGTVLRVLIFFKITDMSVDFVVAFNFLFVDFIIALNKNKNMSADFKVQYHCVDFIIALN
jgi:hypothetical protein